jgi:hypothetical protein
MVMVIHCTGIVWYRFSVTARRLPPSSSVRFHVSPIHCMGRVVNVQHLCGRGILPNKVLSIRCDYSWTRTTPLSSRTTPLTLTQSF